MKLSLMILSIVFVSSCNLSEAETAPYSLQPVTPIVGSKADKIESFVTETRWMPQPVDHAETRSEQFQQQIIILKPQGVEDDAPVFFMLGNETDSTEEKLVALYENYGSPKDFIFITADHRGYGQSISATDQTVPDYVKIDQTLKDYKRLVDQFRLEFTGPWVGAGYSYGGSLAINFAHAYQGTFDLILSSSAPLKYDFVFSEYGKHAEELLGPDLAKLMKGHLERLKPEALYDETWHAQKHVTATVVGLAQIQAIQPLRPMIETLAQQSTPDFVGSLRTDLPPSVFEQLDSWAFIRTPKRLSPEDARTGKFNWYTWKYQQCMEVGTFFVGGIFPYMEEDHIKDCEATFGETPKYVDGKKWDVESMLSHVQDPIIIVSGGKDPWLRTGVMPDHNYKNIDYQFFPNGLHCPDRYEAEAGLKVFKTVRAHLER